MAATGTPTPNIGLRIPLGTDPASVDDINYNSNLIDTKLGAVGNDSVQDQIDDLNSKIANLTSDANPDITIQKTGYTIAQGLASLANQIDYSKLNGHSYIKMGALWFHLQQMANNTAIFTAVRAESGGYMIYSLQCASGNNHFFVCDKGTTTDSGSSAMGNDMLFFY